MADDDRWIRLGEPTLRERLLVLVPIAPLVVLLIPQFGSFGVQLFDLPLPIAVLLIGLAFVVAVGLALLITLLSRPVPRMQPSTRRFRLRRRDLPFDEVTRAAVSLGDPRAAHVLLTFGPEHGRQAVVILTADGRRLLDDDTTEALATGLATCPIGYPTSPYDPDGRFTRHNFPGALDADAAARVVRDPSLAVDLLPGSGSLR